MIRARLTHRWLRRKADRGDMHAACELLRRSHPLLADMTDEQIIAANIRLGGGARAASLSAADAARAVHNLARAFDDAARRKTR